MIDIKIHRILHYHNASRSGLFCHHYFLPNEYNQEVRLGEGTAVPGEEEEAAVVVVVVVDDVPPMGLLGT